MKILGIETSCDETAAAVVEIDDKLQCTLLSNVVASSMDLHVQYGGVVPEIAARSQIESMIPVIDKALKESANIQGSGLDGVQEGDEKRVSRTDGTMNESRKKPMRQSAKSISGVGPPRRNKQAGAVRDLSRLRRRLATIPAPGIRR